MEPKFIAHIRESDGLIQSLFDHLTETAELSEKFASKIGLKKCGKLIGLLHDFGKATQVFNDYIRSAAGQIDPDADGYVDSKEMKGKIDHSTAGAQYIYQAMNSSDPRQKSIMQLLSLVISSHHSGLIDCISPDGKDIYTRRMLKAKELSRIDEAKANIDKNIIDEIGGIIKSADILDEYSKAVKSIVETKNDNTDTVTFKTSLLIRYLFSCLIDADRINTSDFEYKRNTKIRNNFNYIPWSKLIDKLEKKLSEYKNEDSIGIIRKEISDNCKDAAESSNGIFRLEVPTGGGKTLSSLRFALQHADKHKMDRIIYVIPYTSIIDQNAQVAREIFEEKTESGEYTNKVVLEHHSNLTPDEENTRQKLLAENWDSQIVFTTMIQFFESLFGHGTRNVRRLHQLANSVIIFDEIQTLPLNFVYMYNVAMRFIVKGCGSSVVLCTATQPLLDRVEPLAFSLPIDPERKIIKNTYEIYSKLNRIKVINKINSSGYSDDSIADLVYKEAQCSGNALVVVNTKASSVILFKKIEKLIEQYDKEYINLFHLNTHMCAAHRMIVIKELKDKLLEKKPVICVSTQMIEAGVDIDFNSVIRYLAGLDSITQAAGRCNRNGKLSPKLGKVIIVNPENENLERLKDIKSGRDITLRIIDEYKKDPEKFDNDILGLKAMERYYQYFFYDRKNIMNYPVSKNKSIERNDDLFNLLSQNLQSVLEYKRQNNCRPPDIVFRQSFNTASEMFKAIDSPTMGIVVPYGDAGKNIISELCSVREIEKQYGLLKKSQRYSVNVYKYVFEKLAKERAICEVQKDTGTYYLADEYYHDKFGLSSHSEKDMELLYT